MKVWMIRDTLKDRFAKLNGPGSYVPFDWVDREAAHVFRRDPSQLVAGFPALSDRCEVLAFQLVPADLVVVMGEVETGVYVNGKLVEPLNGHDDESDLMHALGVKVEFHEVSHDHLPETLKELEL